MAKDGTSCDKSVGASGCGGFDVFWLDSTINFESNGFAAGFDAALDRFNFSQSAVDEALSTKSWVHAHDQDEVKFFDDPVEHIQGLCGVEDQAALTPCVLNHLKGAVNVCTGVGVETDEVGTSLGKGLCNGVHRFHHQVDINGHGASSAGFGQWLDGLADHGAKGEVGHVVIVHHVKMNPVRPSFNDGGHLVSKACEVGRKNRGCNDKGVGVWSVHEGKV